MMMVTLAVMEREKSARLSFYFKDRGNRFGDRPCVCVCMCVCKGAVRETEETASPKKFS